MVEWKVTRHGFKDKSLLGKSVSQLEINLHFWIYFNTLSGDLTLFGLKGGGGGVEGGAQDACWTYGHLL